MSFWIEEGDLTVVDDVDVKIEGSMSEGEKRRLLGGIEGDSSEEDAGAFAINRRSNERQYLKGAEELGESSGDEVVEYTSEFPMYESSGRTVSSGGTPKNVNFLESLCYAFVQNYGFAILGVPLVFQQSGWILTTVVMLVLSFIANMAPLLLTEAQAMIPGNGKFKLDIEYIGIVQYYFGKIGYWAFQGIINVYILAVNIAAIRVSSQAVDSFLILAFKKTFGIEFYPHARATAVYGPNDWYGNDLVLGISLGYVILAVLLIPLSFMQLKSNIKVQIVSCLIVIFSLVVFVWDFFTQGHIDTSNVPAVPSSISDVSQLVGVFIFSLAYASMIPSWVNQKKKSVSVNRVIWITGGIVTILNYVIPLLAAFAYANLSGDDVFQVMTSSATGSKLTKAAVYAYTLAVITTSVPVYSVTVKNNLYVTGATSWPVAVLIAIVLPWAISWIANSGAMFAFLLNAAALLCGGFTGFFVPIALYIRAQMLHVRSFGKTSNRLGVLPAWLLPYWKPFCYTLLALTVIPTLLQIGVDTYYVIENPPWKTTAPQPSPILSPASNATSPVPMGPLF
jgi:hypothetical protein